MGSIGNQVIIDTDILIDLLRGSENAVVLIKELENEMAKLSAIGINAFELYYVAYKSGKKLQNLTAVRKLLERLSVLAVNLESAEKAGQIHAELEAEGQSIGLRDIMMSAIALTRGCPLLTRNTAHMQKIRNSPANACYIKRLRFTLSFQFLHFPKRPLQLRSLQFGYLQYWRTLQILQA